MKPTISEAVHFAAKAAATAYHDIITINGGDHAAADAAARCAFKCCMPIIEDRESVQAFLATMVRGIELHLITAPEAQQFARAAYLWLRAEPKRRAA